MNNKINNKFDEMKNEKNKNFDEKTNKINKVNARLEILESKDTQLVIHLEPISQIQPKPTFYDAEILKEFELYEINSNDLLDEEELLKELGNFGITANAPSSPNLSISSSTH